MKKLQAGLITVLIMQSIRAGYKWFNGEQVSAPYYFYSTLFSLIVCVAAIIIEISISVRSEKRRGKP